MSRMQNTPRVISLVMSLVMILMVSPFCMCASARAEEPWKTITTTQGEGVYTLESWRRDWPGCTWEDGISEGRVQIVRDMDQLWWRVTHPAGKIGPSDGGAGWRWHFSNKPERCVQMKFRVMFEEGFDFKKSGKLAGVCGGPKTITGGLPCTGYEGWSVRIVWRKERRALAYVYHPNQRGKYGDEFNFPASFQFPIGKPTDLRLEVKMNTVGQRDGHVRVWAKLPDAEEQLMVDRTDMEWTKVDTIGIDSLIFNTFHGGGDLSFAPDTPCVDRFTGFAYRVIQ